jgi:hypothetical protein
MYCGEDIDMADGRNLRRILSAVLILSGAFLCIFGAARQTDAWEFIWRGKTQEGVVILVREPGDGPKRVVFRVLPYGASGNSAGHRVIEDEIADPDIRIEAMGTIEVRMLPDRRNVLIVNWTWRFARWFFLTGLVLIVAGAWMTFRHTARSNLVDR